MAISWGSVAGGGAFVGVIAIILMAQTDEIPTGHNSKCMPLNITQYCDRFSDPGTRCYPFTNTTKGYKDCPEPWIILVREVQEESPIPPSVPIKKSNRLKLAHELAVSRFLNGQRR